jgi:putative phage-type endonuclease
MTRTGFIGGSDVPVILGLPNPGGKSRLTLWAEKIGLKIDDDPASADLLNDGKMLEGPVADRFAIEYGMHVWETSEICHDEQPWFRGHPDRLAIMDDESKRIVEIKCVHPSRISTWDDGPPLHVQAQTQTYMFLSGLHEAYAVAWSYGQGLRVHELTYNDRFCSAMFAKVCEFWELVEKRIEPEAIGLPEEYRVLGLLHPDGKGTKILGPQALTLANEWQREKEIAKEHDDNAKGIGAQLKQMIGDAESAVLPDGSRLTWRKQKTIPRYEQNGIWDDGSEAFRKIDQHTRVLRRSKS